MSVWFMFDVIYMEKKILYAVFTKKNGKYCRIEFDSFRGKNKLYSVETLDFS